MPSRFLSIQSALKLFLFVCVLLPIFGRAQTDLYQLTPVSLDNLSAFKDPPANWKTVGGLKAGYTDTVFSAAAGAGILLDNYDASIRFKKGTDLITSFEHGDIYLELDFMMPKGSNSGIYLQGRYEVQLLDSWGVNFPKSYDCGAIYERWDSTKPKGMEGYEGHPPLKNASLAPGLWQHLEILFQAPRFNASGKKIASAKFIKVVLNGITIHENIILTGPTRGSEFANESALGPIRIQGDHGMVAFRNIKYAALEDLSIPITDLTYEYYEGTGDNWTKFTSKELIRKGKADAIDVRLADAKNNYLLKFAGKMNVPVTAPYHVVVRVGGFARLEIDGKEIIKPTFSWTGGDLITADVQLTKGEHNFVVHLLRHGGWGPQGLGIYFRKPNSKTTALHAESSLPEAVPAPLVQLNVEKEPQLLRSFLFYKDKKLTHCISVGDPAGVHYSYNLRQGGLLQVWKNDFLNTTDMWFERGEPQIAAPMGPAILMGNYFSYVLDKNSIPDSLDPVNTLHYKGYKLDEKRYPAFQYEYANNIVTDRFVPYENGKGLERIISVKPASSNTNAVYRIAEGKQISDLGNGLFAVDDQSYYLKLLPQNGQLPKPFVQDGPKGKELLLNASVNELQYVLYW